MKQITDDIIHDYQAGLWRNAVERHGTTSRVPEEEQQRLGELIRGLYVLQVWQARGAQGNPVRFMAEYSISQPVIETLVPSFVGKHKLPAPTEQAKPVRRADRWKALENWAKTRTYEEYTTEQLVEVAGFSYSTVLDYIKMSPYFKKIKRGVWEIRNPKDDRVKVKNG